MFFQFKNFETAAVTAVKSEKFIEAIVLWNKASFLRGSCDSGFSLVKCAGCFRTHLRVESLRGHDHEHYGFALISLKNWLNEKNKKNPTEQNINPEYALFTVTYVDGTISANRRVHRDKLGGFDEEDQIREVIKTQDLRISELTGWVRPAIKFVEPLSATAPAAKPEKAKRKSPRRNGMDRRSMTDRRKNQHPFDVIYRDRREVRPDDERRRNMRRSQSERRLAA